MKRFFAICMVIVQVVALGACELSFNGNGGKVTSEQTELSAPSNVRVEDGMIYWSSVSNADRYVVQVGDDANQATTTELSYPLSSFRLENGQSYYVKVKALPSTSILYSESPWSANYGPVVYQAAQPIDDTPNEGTVVVDKAKVDQVVKYGIGFGYNFIDDEYFNQQKIKRNSILDIDKLLTKAQLREQTLERFSQKTIWDESIESFATELSTYYNSSSSLGIGIDGISASISNSISISNDFSFKNYSRALFVKSIARKECKDYALVQYGNDLSAYLSDDFADVVYKRGIFANYTDEELVGYLYRNYGTHLLLGVKTGGSCDYYYVLSTNNQEVYDEFKASISVSGSAQFLDFFSASTSMETGVKFKTSYANNESHVTSHFDIVGGSSQGLKGSSDDRPGSVSDAILSSWGASFNDDNAVTIGVSPYGAISLVEILKQCGLTDLANRFQVLLETNANANYQDLLDNFALASSDSGDTVNFAGGQGTADSPYLIADVRHLKNVNMYLEKCYKLIEDIDVTGIDWVPLGFDGTTYSSFSGRFDGDYHTIKGLTRHSGIAYNKDNLVMVGLFGELNNNATVENLIMADIDFEFTVTNRKPAYCLVGAVAGRAYESKIRNCSASGKIKMLDGQSTDWYLFIGGIVGESKNSNFCHCANRVNIQASHVAVFVGGIIGNVLENNTSVKYCYNLGDISIRIAWTGVVTGATGGIIGCVADGKVVNVTNCYSVASYSSIGGHYHGIGAIVGVAKQADHLNTVMNNYYYAEIDYGSASTDEREIFNVCKYSNKKEKADFLTGIEMGALSAYSENAFIINEAHCWIYEAGQYPKLYWEK